MSASFMPRVVTAGVPNRMPEVTNGDLSSKGTMFLFMVMSALINVSSANLPVRSFERRSIRIR